MKTIVKTEQLEKEYVLKVYFSDGSVQVWKAPRRQNPFDFKLVEQFNEIFCGTVYDECIESDVRPELYAIDQEYGVLENYIEEEWNSDTVNLKNASKLPTFFMLEVFLHQTDRGRSASRHLRLKINPDQSRSLCPIDNGFSLQHIDKTKSSPAEDLSPEFIDDLLASAFIGNWSEIETALYVIDGFDVVTHVLDITFHINATCNLGSNTRKMLYDFSIDLIKYLEERRKLLKPALEDWWHWKQDRAIVEKPEIPIEAVP